MNLWAHFDEGFAIDSMNDYKLVLVLGNGFDLDLGLPTSYSNFLESPYFYEFLNWGNILKYQLRIFLVFPEVAWLWLPFSY